MDKFERYDTESGLSHNTCINIYQDRYGFLWIGTANGLNRFDGYEFINYTNSVNDSTTISNNFISDITEDIFGNLWIATQNGLNLYDRKNEDFIRLTKSETRNSLRDNHVRALFADSNFLWIETLDGTLSKLDIKENSFVHYKHNPITQPYYHYHDIFKDNEGKIWVGGRNMGPVKFDPVKESFSYISPGEIKKGKKRDRDVASYFLDNQNRFWISAIDGIYTYDRENDYFDRFLGTSTYSIIQDKNGDIWFGTRNGVYRFNHNTKTLFHYLNDENNSNSLSENHVNQVYEDKDGNIWVATDKGLNKISLQKKSFGHIYHIPENKNALASNNVSTLTADTNDHLWIGYNNKGFDSYHLETAEIKHYRQEDYKNLKSNHVSKLYFDSNNQLWVGLWQGVGFCKYNPLDDEFTHYAYDPNTLKRDWYSDFLEDKNHNFWIGFWGSSGLHLFNRNKERFEPDHFKPSNLPLKQEITALASDKQNLWMASKKGFIYKYQYKTGKYFAYTSGDNDYSEFNKVHYKDIIDFNTVFEILIDKSNQKWLITDSGIINISANENVFSDFPFETDRDYRFLNINPDKSKAWFVVDNHLLVFDFLTKNYYTENINSSPIKNLKYIIQKETSYSLVTHNQILTFDQNNQKSFLIDELKNEIITKVFYDHNNYLWIFTKNDVYVYDDQLSRLKNDFSLPELKNLNILSTYQYSDSTIFIGTDNGIFLINQFKEVKHFCSGNNPEENIVSDEILSVTADFNQNIWIGTDNGLCKYNSEKKAFEAFNQPDRFSLTSHLISDLFEDNNGYIWVGTTNGGLNMIDPETRTIKHFVYLKNDSTSISSNTIHCIFQDQDQNIWVGTDDGLNLFNQEALKFKRFYRTDGLPGDEIMSIEQDNQSNLWIATNNGLSRFNPQNAVFANYYEQDGLQANAFSNASTKLKSGQLVFGGVNGINVFHPEDIDFKYQKPEVQITKFKIFDQVYKTDFINTDEINLHYKENFFTIKFSALNYYNPQQFEYKYLLEGVDPGWVSANNDLSAVYTDIKHGDYIFKVFAIAPDGTEGDIKTLRINIEPPFWQTWWFYTLILIIKFSIIGWILYLRFRKYRAEKENAQLEQKLLRSQMNPHFIFNALFSIQSFIYAQQNEEADRFLTKFSRLLRLILENSRESLITVESEIQTIGNYLDLQKLRFDEKFQFKIIVDPKINKEEIMIPPMLAQPFIENAIEHGFYKKDKKYNLNIGIWLVEKNIIYTIEDNGIGIDKSKKLNKTSSKGHKSLGMKITNERILNLKKITKQNIKIQVIDLEGEGKSGTRVVFTIPVKIKK
ncbi:MAG: two-component regulator propeller domain-containing protein [Bacteroidota bacterium]